MSYAHFETTEEPVLGEAHAPDYAALYARDGHVTIPGLFSAEEMDEAIRDIETWGTSFLETMDEDERAWYVDGGVAAKTVLRKLDNPHAHRAVFKKLAQNPRLTAWLETFVGKGVSVYYSQIFFKPPQGGGPKPVHQDNFYFGPDNNEGVVTAWIALDDATLENGCLYYGKGSHKGPVYDHVAPKGQPYNLLVPDHIAQKVPMSPAPVPKGGVSFHHGTTFHQSSDNRSDTWRRACALHFVQNEVNFVSPALPYDHSLKWQVTSSR